MCHQQQACFSFILFTKLKTTQLSPSWAGLLQLSLAGGSTAARSHFQFTIGSLRGVLFFFYCYAGWGYIGAFPKVLAVYQIYHTWIHPGHCSFILPLSIPGTVSTDTILTPTFEAIVNGIVLLYSFSVCLLLVYRMATDFCKLILDPATLLKLFMVSESFWVEFFGALRWKIVSSANKDSLTTYLPICIPFISSSCLIAVARNSRLCWIAVGRVGTLVSSLTLGEMVSVFPH
jgi:hypothetical protein